MPNANRGQTLSATGSGLRAADIAGMAALVFVLLLLSWLRSRNCMFWGDEIMGLAVLKQPNYASLLTYWRHGIDSSGIWFYVFGRPWVAAFGVSEISLRMYSATGIAASAVVLWAAARRVYATLPVAAAISFTYAFLSPLRWQLANGRTYGLLMLAVATVIYLQIRGEETRQDRPARLFLLATAAAYSFLCGSHILGLLYVAGLLGIQLALDLWRRRFRPSLYIAAACSFIVAAFSRANIQATAALGKPTFWTNRPSLRDLLAVQHIVGKRLAIGLVFLVLVGLLHLRPRRKRASVYVILGGFGILDLLIFLYSRHATSIYVDRYLLPFAVAVVFLFCELFTQLQEAEAPWLRLRKSLPAAFIILAAAGFFLHRLQIVFLPFPNYTSSLAAALPPGLPVIDTDVGTFVDMEFYQHGKLGRTFQFPVDWQVALDPSVKGGVSGFHEMDNWKAVGLYADDILPTAEALAGKRSFLVLASPSNTVWLHMRILTDPAYKAQQIGSFTDDHFSAVDIWSVQSK